MSTTQNSDYCGGCGETDGNKRCIGRMHPISTAQIPSARTDELALDAATEIVGVFSTNGEFLPRLKARVQCIVQRAIEAGQPARHVDDQQTDRKTNEIMEERRYQLTGYVLRHPETQHRAIIESSAVRWVQPDDMAKIMYPQNRQPREALTDEQIVAIANREDVMHGDHLQAFPFARAIEAEINGVKS